MEVLVFNVGGVRYETLRATVSGELQTNLGDEDFLSDHFNTDTGEYFFDRDPDMFKAVLNFLRTGYLHIPSFICGPAAKMELEYWGLPPSKIERCCWTHYNDWNATLTALKRFENDRKSRTVTETNVGCTRWAKLRPIIWEYVSGSDKSIVAKVIDVFSLCFVLLSIFTFLAETTPAFSNFERRPINRSETAVTLDNLTSGYDVIANPLPNATTTVSNTTVSPLSNGTSDDDVWVDPFIEVRIKHPVLGIFDIVCLSYFTLEYVTRVVFAPRRLKHVTSLLAIIDLLALLPDYIEIVVYSVIPELHGDSSAVEFMSTLRVIRVLRIFRLIRHVPGLWILVYTLRASISELMLLVWFMTLGILVFSSLIYFTEDKEEFTSIPEGFWWALITMTTVGYGDMYPKSLAGKIVGSLCAMTGVLMIGFTVPTLVNNFMLYYKHVQFALHTEDLQAQEAEEDPNENTTKERPSESTSGKDKTQTSEKRTEKGSSQECVRLVLEE